MDRTNQMNNNENVCSHHYNIDRTKQMNFNENNKHINNNENNTDGDKTKLRKKDKQKKYRAKRALKAKGSFDESAKDTTPAVALDAHVVAALRSYIEKIDDQSVKSNTSDIISNANHSSSSTIPATSTAETITVKTDVEESVNVINVDETIDITTAAVEESVHIDEDVVTNNIVKENDDGINETIPIEETTKVQEDAKRASDILFERFENYPLSDELNESLKNGLLVSSINNRINRFGYVEYEISIELLAVKGNPKHNTKMVILRRYNDFYVLNALLKAADVERVPGLPRRQIFRFFNDENFLNERQRALDAWLKVIIKMYQYQSEGIKNLIKTFLSNSRSNSNSAFLSSSSSASSLEDKPQN
jgi:hypothetical protein